MGCCVTPSLKKWTRKELEDSNNWAFGFLTNAINNDNVFAPAWYMWNHEIQREFGSERPPYLNICSNRNTWNCRKPLKAYIWWKPLRIRERRFVGNMKEISQSEKFAETFYRGPALLPTNFEVVFRFDLGAPKDALKEAFASWLEKPDVKELRMQVSTPPKKGRGMGFAERLRDLTIYRFASAGFTTREIRTRLQSEFKRTNLVGDRFDWARALRLTRRRINAYWQRWFSLCENDPAMMYASAAATRMLFPAGIAKKTFPQFRTLPAHVKWIQPILPKEQNA